MFLTGIGIPVFATLNAGLGRDLSNPIAATTITFAVGLALSLIALAFVGPPPLARYDGIPLQNFFGVVFMVAYVSAITFFAPRIGVGNAVFFVLLGQLVAAAVIDHFGLMGALPFTLTPRRALGIAVMALGVWLAKRTA
jgi:transporter family-2 protein